MAKVTIGFALVLILLGLGAYFGTGATSITALIPSFVGLLLLIAGLIGLDEKKRKHAMHLAAVLALLGFLGSARGLGQAWTLLVGGTVARPTAAVVQAMMALLCGVLLALYVKSFIAARKARAIS